MTSCLRVCTSGGGGGDSLGRRRQLQLKPQINKEYGEKAGSGLEVWRKRMEEEKEEEKN